MNTVITAIYENGALHPIEKVDLPEHSKVTIILQNQEDNTGIEKSPWQALQAFRNVTDLEALNIDTRIFDRNRAEINEREIDL